MDEIQRPDRLSKTTKLRLLDLLLQEVCIGSDCLIQSSAKLFSFFQDQRESTQQFGLLCGTVILYVEMGELVVLEFVLTDGSQSKDHPDADIYSKKQKIYSICVDDTLYFFPLYSSHILFSPGRIPQVC